MFDTKLPIRKARVLQMIVIVLAGATCLPLWYQHSVAGRDWKVQASGSDSDTWYDPITGYHVREKPYEDSADLDARHDPAWVESVALIWLNTSGGRYENMSVLGDKVLDEALDLPVDVRLRLIEKLLESLNLPTQAEIDRLWAEEAERRVSQIDSGEVELIPAEAVFARIRAKYRR